MKNDQLEQQEIEQARALLAPLRANRPTWDDARRDAVWQEVVAAREAAPRGLLAKLMGGNTWIVSAGLACATAVLIGLWIWRAPEPISAPDTVTVSQGTLTMGTSALPSGAVVDVEGNAEILEATRNRTSVALHAGRIRNQVPKLAEGARYHVQTSLADVEVRGTTFTVEARPDGSTFVSVTEGEVFVTPRDGRPGFSVLGGQSKSLDRPTPEPVDPFAGAKARIDAMPDGLSRRNAVLELGHRLDRERPLQAHEHWMSATQRYPAGAHAEEFLFRATMALRKAEQHDEAKAAGALFRDRFPQSPRINETR